MKKINFTFLRNKSFLAGLLSGVIITAAAAILIFSLTYPPVGSSKAKGTLVPELTQTGTVQASGTQCDYIYADVLFNIQGTNIVLRCHAQDLYSAGTTVKVTSTTPGEFCQNNGIFVYDESAPAEN